MNNKVIAAVVGIILVLALLGGGYMLMKKGSAPETTPTQQTTPVTQSATEQNVQGTIKSLLSSGRSMQCSFNSSTGSAQVSGTVLVAGGKMRGDFQVAEKDLTANSHLINDSQFVYIWTDNSKMGIKMAKDLSQTPSSQPGTTMGPDMNQSYTYSCQDWSPDSSLFTLPTGVTFTEVAVPKTTVPTPPGTSQTPPTMNPYCSYCTNLPAGPAKTACLTQYNCQ